MIGPGRRTEPSGNVANSGTDLVDHLPAADRAKPAALDLDMSTRTRAAGVGAMIPFTLNDAELKTVAIYRIDAASPSPIFVRRDTLAKKNAYLYAAPPFSASLLVFEN